ncbi:MAG: GNAT family N-acetyltransferase [Aureliella sp.]
MNHDEPLKPGCNPSTVVFETSRLSVRPLLDSDIADFHEMQSDDEVMRYTTGSGFDEAENHRQLHDCISKYSEPQNEFWVWAISRKKDAQFVGTCAIVPNEGKPEIGYRLLRRFFGNGFGREICDGLVEFGIRKQKLTELVAYVDVRNIASVKILDQSRLDFVQEIENKDGVVDRFYRWKAE